MTTELRQAINKISVAGAVKEADFKVNSGANENGEYTDEILTIYDKKRNIK